MWPRDGDNKTNIGSDYYRPRATNCGKLWCCFCVNFPSLPFTVKTAWNEPRPHGPARAAWPMAPAACASPLAHCSYLDIYISQKVRICLVDFKVQFQTNVQAKNINFLNWEFWSIMFIFLLSFAGVFKSCALYTKELKHLNCDFEKWL